MFRIVSGLVLGALVAAAQATQAEFRQGRRHAATGRAGQETESRVEGGRGPPGTGPTALQGSAAGKARSGLQRSPGRAQGWAACPLWGSHAVPPVIGIPWLAQ